MYKILDYVSRKEVTPSNLVFTGDENPWDVVMNLDEIQSRINADYFKKSPPFVSKYLPLMPIKDYATFVSLKEGSTPLIKSRSIGDKLGIDLHFKLEMQNPTGSFKDRGSAVDLTIARELGAKAIVVASTGNMAASCACYAAAAQLPCFIFVPEDTPASKLSQAISYGGRIVQIKGTYTDAAKLAEEVAKNLGFYLGGDYAFRVEGQKTAAFELIDQFFFQIPDKVILPMGCGTNMAAYAKGFSEYKQLGFINHAPQLIGVQATGASSIVNAFKEGKKTIEALPTIDTIASAIAVNYPLDGVKALGGIYETKGQALAVTDKEMLEAQFELSREEGIFVETSCASSLAALKKLVEQQDLLGQTIVCIMTGGGLKDPSSILKIAIKPPTIYPDVEDFLSLYENSFFEGRTVSFVDRATVIYRTKPTTLELQKYLLEQFNITYSEKYLIKMLAVMEKFLLKGKPITFADLQDIVQESLETTEHEEAFKVSDFQVETGNNRKSEAKVSVLIKEDTIEASATGVGPVDAVLSALRKACGEYMQFSLADYKVAIRGQGSDAVVHVDLKLKQEGVVSVGTGTSPDIIQASIEAFEEAYNGFFRKKKTT